MYRLRWLLVVLILAALACRLPGADDRLQILEVSVTPVSGSGSFTGTVVYTPGGSVAQVVCMYMNVDTGLFIEDFAHVIDVAADTTGAFAKTQASFEFKLTQPGKYRLVCEPGAVDPLIAQKSADFTVVAAVQYAKLILNTDQDVQNPALDLIVSTWCLYPTSFPPTSPDDPGLIRISETGKLEGNCVVAVNDIGLMPHEATLTGQFNRETGALTFELKVTWDDPISGVHAEQVLVGSGTAASPEKAEGSAELTLTCTDGVGDPRYEPLGCYGEYGGPYWDSYTVTGTVPWRMEFAP